jgi:hypothetical protein
VSNFTAADGQLVVDCVELTHPPERCAAVLEMARLREIALGESERKVDLGPYGNVATQHAVNHFQLQEAVRETCTGCGAYAARSNKIALNCRFMALYAHLSRLLGWTDTATLFPTGPTMLSRTGLRPEARVADQTK